MKKCNNCGAIIREKDMYCRNCGVKVSSEVYTIFLNIFSLLFIIGSVFFVILFVASYFLE